MKLVNSRLVMTTFCFVFSWSLTATLAFYMPKMKQYPHSGNTGYPSFLSPLIYDDMIEEALRNCTVEPLVDDHKSYAGFLTVRSTLLYSTHLFFWFFPADLADWKTAPVVLCLQGGTGVSFLLGVFEGHGPYFINPVNGKIRLRPNRITKTLSVLYIDHLPGSGYSFTGDDIGYTVRTAEVAELLILAVRQFLFLFQDIMYNHFYIYAESYATSYALALSESIYMYNKRSNNVCPPINITGIIVGSTFFNPVDVISRYAERFYQLGFLSTFAVSEFQELNKRMNFFIKKKNFIQAFEYFDKMILGILTPYPTLYQNTTYFSSFFNYRIPHEADIEYHDAIAKVVQSDDFRRAVHVGNHTFHVNYEKVLRFMSHDILTMKKPLVSDVLKNGYRVLIYHGQLDALVPYQAVVDHLNTFKWIQIPRYSYFRRCFYYVNYQVAGYFQKYASLMEVMLLDAGHMASKDQPNAVLELIERFINKRIY